MSEGEPRPTSVVALIGNPRAGSRTYGVAAAAAEAIVTAISELPESVDFSAFAAAIGESAEPEIVDFSAFAAAIGEPGEPEIVDLSALAPVLLAPGPSAGVELALELVSTADILVVASPTYKGTYTGLLKVFLDRLPPGALSRTAALPLLVMGNPAHSLAVEVHLRPLLVELGAFVPTPGLALLESQFGDLDAVLANWAARVAPQLARRPLASSVNGPARRTG